MLWAGRGLEAHGGVLNDRCAHLPCPSSLALCLTLRLFADCLQLNEYYRQSGTRGDAPFARPPTCSLVRILIDRLPPGTFICAYKRPARLSIFWVIDRDPFKSDCFLTCLSNTTARCRILMACGRAQP